ncbi:hypothetical protein CC1G_15714 [Coprinopsis cinerea okayama7|uniref:Integral membrane protein n=1 Tax=Coprinopsis cinerea (strain Okayama-7 / 130 / ATCC MYA-4618 / FGSC 9003) TaxID=240176 RepID=D6RQH5_COPC7|nr:hypothetical protein CC1G_15714 [Coprinopsis cinerea okayama7\|eukprot:XP_002910285.1 hypothetical protein CC1G_15714 [Coprinopsis cinerea okayama7\
MAFGASSVLIVVSMMLAEAIMFIRLYALSGHKKRMCAWLLFQFLGVHVTVFVVFSLFVKSVKFIPSPLSSIPGCIPYRFDSHKLLIVFGMVVASQLGKLLRFTNVENGDDGIHKFRSSGSPILLVFYRDGFFYFVSLTLVTIGNIIFDRRAPPELRFMLTLPQGVLHSVLACRLILHIYDFARRELYDSRGWGGDKTGTGLDFARDPTTHHDTFGDSEETTVAGFGTRSGVSV